MKKSRKKTYSSSSKNWISAIGHLEIRRKWHYFGKDHLGSVRAVMNKWGSPLRTFDYDVSGTPLQDRPERFRYGFTGIFGVLLSEGLCGNKDSERGI